MYRFVGECRKKAKCYLGGNALGQCVHMYTRKVPISISATTPKLGRMTLIDDTFPPICDHSSVQSLNRQAIIISPRSQPVLAALGHGISSARRLAALTRCEGLHDFLHVMYLLVGCVWVYGEYREDSVNEDYSVETSPRTQNF